MPQRYQELKASYNNVIDKILQCQADIEKNAIEKFLLSMTLRIWSCNIHYTNEYGEAIRTIQTKPYTMEQIVTAMACCGERIRKLSTPTFLKNINSSNEKREILNAIGDYLAAVALINGDFTTAEAACWEEMMDFLVVQCLNETITNVGLDFIPRAHITEMNQDGYLKSCDEKEKKIFLMIQRRSVIYYPK